MMWKFLPLSLLIIVFFSITGNAQQRLFLNSNYDVYVYFNPAAQSTSYLYEEDLFHAFDIFYGNQWGQFNGQGIEGQPGIYSLNYNGYWDDKNIAGASLICQEVGALKQVQLQMRYSRQLIKPKFFPGYGDKPSPTLFIGGSIQAGWLKIDFNKMTGFNELDPVIRQTEDLVSRSFSLNASFGVFTRIPLSSKIFLVGGLSAIQVAEFTKISDQNLKPTTHFYGNVGFVFELNTAKEDNNYHYFDTGIVFTKYSLNAFADSEIKAVPGDFVIHGRFHFDYKSNEVLTLGGNYVHGRRSFQLESSFLFTNGIGIGFAFDVISFSPQIQEIFGKFNTGEIRIMYRPNL